MTADLILIGCTKTKRSTRAKARDLYDPSHLFRGRRTYAERSGLPWGILSADAGVVHPDQLLDPYDFTIERRIRADGGARGWAIGCIQSAVILAAGALTIDDDGLPHLAEYTWPTELTIEVHAGIDYVRTVELARPAFRDFTFELVHPVAGLGIGAQRHFYADGQQAFAL